ncbi:hypothetical protein ACFV03_51335 [Streptomyces mirabilis]|uniref:hypothetical protein n=1 Tax=Streptomyces mirabilis TaxID=68239 RepID=UPI0036896A56
MHNLRTIAFVAPTRRYLVARETLDVIAPLARAAGLTDVSREPHDLSSAALQPTPTASAVTTRMLAMLILLLPTPTGARWREEWHAELTALPTRRARTRFTLRVLRSTPRLSWTLRRAACRDVTCFTTEEEGVGLASRAPWLLETDVQEKVGVNFSRGPIWEPYMVEDRNLVTGQNPASAAVLGNRMLEILK